ncbi:MAG: SpoIIE family protein phosphatase [Clostridia bacterium]|nr:SpoIIE family protein phosphatase [Clostridia bacterium]
MRKLKHITLGGIQQKVFNLVLIMLILVMAAYSVVIVYQMNSIGGLVNETNDRQKTAITAISQGTMDQVIAGSLGNSTRMQAQIADDMFSDTADTVNTVADAARMLFEAPERYSTREVQGPDAALDGQASVQLLTSEGVDPGDPAVAEKLGLIGNLSETMLAVYRNAEVDSCYIALPEGVMLLVDDHASSKLDGEGKVLSISIRERDWYRGAVESGKLYFTDISADVFTGQYCVMCAVPVYVDGEIAAVVGADLFLDNMEAYVNASDENGGFVCIVNSQGHVVFSPRTEGVFEVKGEDEAQDLRALGNAHLGAFIDDALAENTDVKLIEAEGASWYTTGAPIETVGWTVISLVDKAVTDQPTVMMAEQYNGISAEALASFSDGIAHARVTIVVLLVVVTILALIGALTVSKRIVKPLETMTKRVVSLGGEDLQFMMEDTYRTGDEIEALAESFATLSARTLQYVDQVRAVTAEKERIGAELNMATAIQASQLPRLFPAFPNRPEFDVYASMKPAKEVGGDFYDFFLIDDDHIGLVMADVSGKGVPAALFMMVSRVLIKSHLQNGESPAEALESVNDQLCESNETELFVTVWAAVLEISTGKGVAANAGHEHPAIRRKNGEFALQIYRHSPAVATMEGIPFKEHAFRLDPGDSLFVYTDGVAEATNADNELFGNDRMLDALNADPDASPKEVLSNVMRGIDAFVMGAQQFDDITMLCLKYNGPAQSEA